MRWLVLAGLICVVAGGWLWVRDSTRWHATRSVKPMELSTHAVALLRGEGRVGAGMTKDQVMDITGSPYNPVEEDVWIWSFDAPRPSTPSSWRKWGEDGALFLVFEDGRTISSFCATGSASPEELYAAKREIEGGRVPERYRLEDGVK